MHEFVFSDVAIPAQHFCLTLPLRDYSIGHRLLFMRQRNPLVFGDESAFNHLPSETKIFWLIESVSVCNQTYAHRMQLEKAPTKALLNQLAKDTKQWRKLRDKSQAEFLKTARADALPTNGSRQLADLNDWWALEIAQFRNYLNSSRIVTKSSLKREPFPFLPLGPMPDAKGRECGGPQEATLIQFLINANLVKNTDEAMEYPFALAEIHYYVRLEREGSIKILNTEEIEFQEMCEARDLESAQAAGFNTVEEHIDFIKGNAKKKNSEAEDQAKTGGLASEIPAELKGTS